MSDAETLAPCPFCGGTEIRIRANGGTWNGGMRPPQPPVSFDVEHHCPRSEGQPSPRMIARCGKTEADAIAAWNRRPHQDEGMRERVARLDAYTSEQAREGVGHHRTVTLQRLYGNPPDGVSLADLFTADIRAILSAIQGAEPVGWTITYADGSAAFAFTTDERDDAIAEARPGATSSAVYAATSLQKAQTTPDAGLVGELVEGLSEILDGMKAARNDIGIDDWIEAAEALLNRAEQGGA